MDVINHIPEAPSKETWNWFSDILKSYNGEEQRISLRGSAPRYSFSLNLKTTSQTDLFSLWGKLVKGRNEFWIPEYHLSVAASSETSSGSARLYYNPAYTDIREGEKILVGDKVLEILNLEIDGATLTTNLTSSLPKGSWLSPVGSAILADGASVSRKAVDGVGEFSIKGTFNRGRSSVIRPGTANTLTLWQTVPVLDVTPIANENVTDSIINSQTTIDNKISTISIVNKWQDSKIKSTRQFLVSRSPEPTCAGLERDLDYWRHFFNYCRGSARKFWLPTYRTDLIPAEAPADGASSILTKGFSYALHLFNDQATHVYIEIATSQGTHRCEITGVGSEGENTRCTFTPALPSGWVDVKRISNIVPSRIDGDSTEWEHHSTHSILTINFRSAENE